MPLEESVFEKGDEIWLAGPLASLAWFSVALVTLLFPAEHSAIAMGSAFAVVAILLAVWSIVTARRPASRYAQRIFPWFIFLAVSVEVWEFAIAKAGPQSPWGWP